jgi:hypothetical protein
MARDQGHRTTKHNESPVPNSKDLKRKPDSVPAGARDNAFEAQRGETLKKNGDRSSEQKSRAESGGGAKQRRI